MKSNIIKIFTLFALLLGSCTKADLDLETPLTGNEESVKASLSLSVDAFSAGTATALSSQTKAVGDNEDPSTEIVNLWVIQVNGTTDDSKIVASRYIHDYSDETAEIEFIPSSNYQTIICLANTFQPGLELGHDATLADVKALKWSLLDDNDYCHTEEKTGLQYMYMSGATITPISDSDNIEVTLKRSIAKINFKIDNIANSNLIITSITMNGVPEIGNYYVNRDDLGDIFPSAPEVYSYTAIKDLNITEKNSKTFTFYIPTNKQGTSGAAGSHTKPLYANPSASYVTVVAHEAEAKDGADVGIYRYTFYLGADLSNDYNIEPNKEYTYDVDFKSKGSVGTDLRIKDLGNVDWRNEKSSNCYILNPVAEVNRVFYIPIEKRTEDFWGNTHYGNDKSKIITENVDWTYEVLWYDCATDPIANLDPSKSIKIEKADNNGGMYQEALKVTLGKGFNNWGNVVVAVKGKDGNTISWSWHLWLTDYDPNSHTYTSRETGAYKVDGGEIHRYDGKLWETGGVYADKFIMDRNLGARAAHSHNGAGAGAIYYQWGSKNPIPGNGATFIGSYGDGKTSPKLVFTQYGETFATATENPTTHYYVLSDGTGPNGLNWCNEGISSSTTHFWNDHNLEYDPSNPTNYSGKSIFDPSPLGWKLPVNGTWSDFDFEKHTDENGKWVFPKFPWKTDSRTYNNYAYYPAQGDRSNTSGKLGSIGSGGHIWCATPNGNFNGYHLLLSSTSMVTSSNRSRAFGLSVRPIQE